MPSNLTELGALLMPQKPEAAPAKPGKREIHQSDVDKVVDLLRGKSDGVQGQGEEGADADEGQNAEEVAEGERLPVKIAELAEQLEWEPEALYNVVIPLPGDAGELSIGALKDQYMELQNWKAEREGTESTLAEQLEQLEVDRQAWIARMTAADPAELTKANAELLEAQRAYDRIDWERLERDNPGQAALYRIKLREMIDTKQLARDGIRQNIEGLQREIAQQEQQKRAVIQKQAMNALVRAIPSWASSEVFAQEGEQLVQFGIKQGVPETVLRGIDSPELLAYLYRTMKTALKVEKSKPVETPPKVLKPQAAANLANGREVRRQNQLAEARKSKDMRVKVSAASNLIADAMRPKR